MTVKSKIVLNGLKKELPTVRIIEPFQPEVIECESKEDFSEIINSDPEKYNVMTTQQLNKIFKIPGYKVTKIKGELCLRNIKPCEKLGHTETLNEEIKNIKIAFNQLSEQLDQIKQLIFEPHQ